LRISTITVTFNCAELVHECLASVSEQSHDDVEHVVIDGASTDGTLDVLQAHRGSLAVLVSEPDSGIYDALNKGIVRTDGEVVGLLHADDLYADSEVLARVAEAFVDPEVDAVYGDLVYVSKSDPSRVIRGWRAGEFSPARLRWGWMPPHPALFLRRSLYERFGLFDTRYRIAADYDLMLRILSQLSGKVVYLPEVLVRMRMGGVSNRSLSNIVRKSWEDYQVLRTNRVGGLGALAWKNLSKLPQFFRR
jgi:glycosyltransferase involved in cell wall biosynthesis